MRPRSSSFPFAATLLCLCSLCYAQICNAQSSASDLDAVARRVIAQQQVAGASVLVAHGDRILLYQGYGFADLGLEAPAKPDTVYHVVGPMLPFTGIAVMQLVERGKLSLNDDIAQYVPEFPLLGHHVTIRQLLAHTSGIVDYHYLGDPIDSTSRQPRALDEVMALYANRPWVNQPGIKWDWSISGFQLLVTVIERVSGQSFSDYMQQNILTPAGMASTTYCDDSTLVHGLAHSYRQFDGHLVPANEDDMAVNYDLRYCSNVADLFHAWRAVRAGKLISPDTLKMMSTAEGAGLQMTPSDPERHYGMALTLGHEDTHRSIGQNGSLLGYSGALYEFPADDLTVVVLTNTEDQNAAAIASALARKFLNLPDTPARPARLQIALADAPTSLEERTQLTGTFVLQYEKVPPTLHDSFLQYRRTYRVFDENGRLMIEALGQAPERLLKQSDGKFAMRSSPQELISFTILDHQGTQLRINQGPDLTLAGQRIGPGDPRTFHRQYGVE
ncbi:MAG: serine hydrolase domain-containing protein [Terracidiphilus sp.]|jgi:CubicO group peptidase (beta-lactamase class C family)